MKGLLAASTLLALVSVAHADTRRATYRWTDPSLVGSSWAQPEPAGVSHVIFMNRCTGGCTLQPGGNTNDSTSDTSSIPTSPSIVSQYSGTDSQWNQIVNCVKQTYAPFNVQIVTTRPTSGNYHMAIVAGTADEVGITDQGVLGVSPFSCGYIPNSISFSFANTEPSNIDDICWTVAQETAHSWGLDHKYDNRDPMTYLSSGPAMKTFQNQTGSCGEYSARSCKCSYSGTGTSGMNSYALIMATFGASGPDTTKPTVSITSPANNSVVNPGFAITADANDDRGIDHVQLKIDGQAVGSPLTAAPFKWTAPSSLSGTAHQIEVDAYDAAGNMASAMEDVSFPMACQHDTDCMSGQVCSNSQCVAGPGMAGGLGSTCTMNSDCVSNSCADDGQGHQYCVSSCNPTGPSTCPSNFECLDAGGGNGVCWPNGNNPGGGGGNTGGCDAGGGGGQLLLGLGFAAALITRRRRS
ncbi:MAG TPA: Ig-like domain-containing protein [Kofleriaceae bacterium]|nr:Ig-like domain-containing protein [Kofleriaceae bacterium]